MAVQVAEAERVSQRAGDLLWFERMGSGAGLGRRRATSGGYAV